MPQLEKQKTGFRFGIHRLEALEMLGEVTGPGGRKYRLVDVRTGAGERYLSLRLYNAKGKFIKQLLFEHEVRIKLAYLLGMGWPSQRPA